MNLAGAECALHRGRPAELACPRCGRFCCRTCLAPTGNCRWCEQRNQVPGGGGGLRGELRTWWGVLSSPRATFTREALHRSSVSASLYALTVLLIAALAQLALALALRLSGIAEASKGVFCLATGFALVWLLILPALEWVVAWLAGGRARFDALILASGLALSPMVFGVVPQLMVAMVGAGTVLKIVGYRYAGGLSWREGLLAVLGTPLLLGAIVYRLA